VAYGGPDRRWLYVTEADSATVQRVELDVPGLALYSHAA
jgi:gluconolactonase